MSEYVNLYEAKTQLSHWVDEVQSGREVVICKRNIPVAKLSPVAGVRKERKIGLAKGTFSVTAAFFEPLPDDIAASFEGRS